MSHYAKVVDGLVEEVIVAEQDFIDNHCEGTWIQTSYNTMGGKHYTQEQVTTTFTGPDGLEQEYTQAEFVEGGTDGLRKNFAGTGYTYDEARDAFIPPQPSEGTWTLNEDTCLWVEVE
tara:strand:+ start:950 stop:1303 length:354 start_codon:yes stop_codon:yes gene_type:complete